MVFSTPGTDKFPPGRIYPVKKLVSPLERLLPLVPLVKRDEGRSFPCWGFGRSFPREHPEISFSTGCYVPPGCGCYQLFWRCTLLWRGSPVTAGPGRPSERSEQLRAFVTRIVCDSSFFFPPGYGLLLPGQSPSAMSQRVPPFSRIVLISALLFFPPGASLQTAVAG